MWSRKSITFLIVLTVLTLFLYKTNTKNACSSYFDYLLINFGGSCYYNPDVDLSVPDLIKKYTGDVQTYSVTTEDGYILSMFRIARKNPKGVVLFQPPMSAGSIAWLSDSGTSLGMELWKKGYDVWLSNHRGISYSRKHINLTEKDPQFWDFGFHEIAMYDLEPQFEIIAKETKSKIIYIGYSLSSTEALVYASLKPEKAEQFVDSFILIAPLVISRHLTSLFKYILQISQLFPNFFNAGEFLTFELVRTVMNSLTASPYLLSLATSMVMGWTMEMDPTLYPYLFAHYGRGISNRVISHYGQIYTKGSDFLMYDYGEKINREKYGSDVPPPYPLGNIKNKIYVVYGDRDSIATPKDIKEICEKSLPKEVVAGLYPIPNHNHLDYIFSKHRRKKTYKTLFTIIDKITKQSK